MQIENANIKTDNVVLKFRHKFLKGQHLLTSFINNGNKYLNAIVLLYNKDGKPLADLELTKKNPYLRLDNQLTEIIQNNLMDIVVYGRRAPFERCSYYERLAPQLSGRKYALKEYGTPNGPDCSLNRCTISTDSISPEAFKIGSLTPGADNDCTGIHFIIQTYVPQLLKDLAQVNCVLLLI
jgi:hypothetical protein